MASSTGPLPSSVAQTIRGAVPALVGAALAAIDARARGKNVRASAYLRIFQRTYNLSRTTLVSVAGVGVGADSSTFAAQLPRQLTVDGVWGTQSRLAAFGALSVASLQSQTMRGWVGRMPAATARSQYNSWLASMPDDGAIFNCVLGSILEIDDNASDETAITAMAQWASRVVSGARSACRTVTRVDNSTPQLSTTNQTRRRAREMSAPALLVTAERTTPGAQWPWVVVGVGVVGLIGYFSWQRFR